jgi:hypothetical protein
VYLLFHLVDLILYVLKSERLARGLHFAHLSTRHLDFFMNAQHGIRYLNVTFQLKHGETTCFEETMETSYHYYDFNLCSCLSHDPNKSQFSEMSLHLCLFEVTVLLF